MLELRAKAEAKGLPVPRLVLRRHAEFPGLRGDDGRARLECSPGTFVLHDDGYGPKYPDLAGFTPAAVLLTRVISRPTREARDARPRQQGRRQRPAAGEARHAAGLAGVRGRRAQRGAPGRRDAGRRTRFKPGDVVYAMPAHVCPTVALHKEVLVAEGGRICGKWTVAARDRVLTV